MSLKVQYVFVSMFLGLILVAVAVNAQSDVETNRIVRNNTIISDQLPKINISVAREFKYVGKFPFKIRDIAGGERFVFVDAEKGKVKRMFIAQFEGFFKHIDDFYRYSFKNALTFGAHKFRHNPYAYSNKESHKNRPKGESALTVAFLKEKGYWLEDELMMYRYITVPDEEKKHELILFYFENISETKHSLAEFYKNDSATDLWKGISGKLMKRSLKAFRVE